MKLLFTALTCMLFSTLWAPPLTTVTLEDAEPTIELALPEVVITPYVVTDSLLFAYLNKHVKAREGFRALPYKDPGDGELAVGYGTKISQTAAREIIARGGITQREAEQMSWEHYLKSVEYCQHYFGTMPLMQQTAVVSLMRGMGIGNLLKSPLAGYIRRRDSSARCKQVWLHTAVKFENNRPSRELEANMWSANADAASQRYVWEVVNGKRTPSRYSIP